MPSASGEWRAIGTVEVTSSRSVLLIPDVTVILVKVVLGLPTLILFRSVDTHYERDGGVFFGIKKPWCSYSGGFEFKYRPEIGYSELFVFSPVPLSISCRHEATISSFQALTQNFSLRVGLPLGLPYNSCFILKFMLKNHVVSKYNCNVTLSETALLTDKHVFHDSLTQFKSHNLIFLQNLIFISTWERAAAWQPLPFGWMPASCHIHCSVTIMTLDSINTGHRKHHYVNQE